jgi:hypothetical protein
MLSLNKHSIIRTIYLYLFALVGLTLLTIGVVRLVDLGLKMYVFTKAEEQTYKPAPQIIRMGPDGVTAEEVSEMAKACEANSQLTEEQRKSLAGWLQNYETWKEEQISPETLRSIQRQRTASQAFAFIIVGLPLYLYHWRIIRKETREKEE